MTAAASSAPNPGYLKLELAVKGVRLDETARLYASGLRASPAAAERPYDIEIVLPQDVCVNVAIAEETSGDSPFLLSGQDDHFILQRNGDRVDVRLVSPPSFYQLHTGRGRPMWQVGTVYGGFIAINAAAACGFSLSGAPCRFCRSGSGIPIEEGFPIAVEEVVEVVRAAFAEGAAEFVYFNVPYVGSEDAGIAFLEPYIGAVKRHFDTLIAVQMHPPKSNRWVDRTYAMGVDALSYAVEIYDHDLLGRRCAGRVRHIGRERYYEALQYAATIFPSGTVWSDLVVGLEPAESTMRGIDALTGIRVLPVLSLFRPRDEHELRGHPLPTIDEVVPVYAHLFHTVRQAGINMGWVRDLSFAVTPLEARFFAGDNARIPFAMQQFYRSKLGTLAARGLSRLRRRLRVRTVSDSFDSSRL
jgi:hypothetical protein